MFFSQPQMDIGVWYICFCLPLQFWYSSISNLRLNSNFILTSIGIFSFAQLEYFTFSISNILSQSKYGILTGIVLYHFSLFAGCHIMKAFCSFLYKINLQQMLDGAEHLISCHWIAFLSGFSHLQLIQNSAPSIIRFCLCNIWIVF